MQNVIECEVVAQGSVNADGSPVVLRGLDYSAARHAIDGVGIYRYTLDRDIDAAECVIIVTPRTTPDVAASVVHTSDTFKTVNMREIDGAPAAIDCCHDIKVIRISGGPGR